METGAITEYMDVAQLALYAFWIGFFLLTMMVYLAIVWSPGQELTGSILAQQPLVAYAMNFVVFFGALGNTIGNILLYEAVREKGLSYILKFNFLIEIGLK